jgi:hypothetical protein
MFQLSLQAFQNVQMNPTESNVVFFPTMKESVRLAIGGKGERHFYVTKRSAKWFESPYLQQLRQVCLQENVGLIHLIRDPRDVLTSRHLGDSKRRSSNPFYVSPDHWLRSIDAAEWLFREVAGQCPAATLRYEDIVLDPQSGIDKLKSEFGLELREDVESWAALTKYVQNASSELVRAMHGVRDIDGRSIGRWKNSQKSRARVESLLLDASVSQRIRGFLQQHRYE